AKLVKDENKKRLFLVLLAFNPAMLGYFIEGRDDIFMYAFLFIGFYFLYKKKYLLSGIPMALAFATKQSVWPLFPFYIVYLFSKTRENKNNTVGLRNEVRMMSIGSRCLRTIKMLIPFLIIF